MIIEVNITKTKFFVILGVVLLFGFVGIVYAFNVGLGGVSSPGHPLNQIQGYFAGDAYLEQSLDKFCQRDGTNCASTPFPKVYQNEKDCQQNNDCPIDCNAGDRLTGGGFHVGNSAPPPLYSRAQSDLSGWECRILGTGGKCYAVCLDTS